MGGFQSLNVSALHAQSLVDLPALVEVTPALFSELEALILLSEFLANSVEIDFLDDLETES